MPAAAVLFDLDGTLLDTAPDMVGALNDLLAEERAAAIDYALARAHVSNGALGLLRIAFREIDDLDRERLHRRYLELYAARLAVDTRPFPGIAEQLDQLERRGVAWGVVTNKPSFLTEPLLTALDLAARCRCVVSGDTVTPRKPHPAPLLHAAAALGLDPATACYVGDAARDIQAGRAAGMRTVAALYGYITPGDDPRAWGADHLIEHPDELSEILTR